MPTKTVRECDPVTVLQHFNWNVTAKNSLSAGPLRKDICCRKINILWACQINLLPSSGTVEGRGSDHWVRCHRDIPSRRSNCVSRTHTHTHTHKHTHSHTLTLTHTHTDFPRIIKLVLISNVTWRGCTIQRSIHSFSSLFYDRSKACSKASSPYSAI
jgi:hypothetical protein